MARVTGRPQAQDPAPVPVADASAHHADLAYSAASQDHIREPDTLGLPAIPQRSGAVWDPAIGLRHVRRTGSRRAKRAHPVQSRPRSGPAPAQAPRLRLPHSRPGPHAGRRGGTLASADPAAGLYRLALGRGHRPARLRHRLRPPPHRRAARFLRLGGRVVLGTPKSHQSRTVPLPRFVAAELAAAVGGKRPDDLVFTMPGGSVMRLSNWRHATFLPARARAGLSDRFRILDLYGHLYPGEMDRYADRLNQAVTNGDAAQNAAR